MHRLPHRSRLAVLALFLLLSPWARLAAVEPLTVAQPVWSFVADAGWSVWWPDAAKPKPYTLTPTAEGLEVRIEPGAEELVIGLWSERFKVHERLAPAQELEVALDLRSGAALQIGLNLIDEQEEGLAYTRQSLAPGAQQVRWRLADAPLHTWGERRNGALDGRFGLWDLALVRPAGATVPVVCVLRTVTAMRRVQPASLVSVALAETSPLHLLAPGTKPALTLSSSAPVPVTVFLSVADEDWSGAVRKATERITIPAQGRTVWRMPGAAPARGIHWIDAAVADAPDTAPVVRERLPYAVLPGALPRPAAEGFLFGLNVGIPGPGPEAAGELDRTCEAIRWLGLRQVRVGANWDWLEHEPGQWNQGWLQALDTGMGRFSELGVRQQFLLSYSARHAVAPDLRNGPYIGWLFAPPDVDLWRGYVRKMVDLAGKRVDMWEVWNEADLHDFWYGTYEQYRDLLRASREEIRRGDPTRKVLTSGFAFCWPQQGGPAAEFPWRLAREERSQYDVLAYHLHYDFQNFARILDQELRQLRDQAGDPPLLFNETAVNLDVFGERGQAEQLPKKLIYAWSHGAIGYSWFKLLGGLRQPIPGGDRNWGVFTEDWHPRAVFVAYHTLLGVLADGTYRERFAGGVGRYAFRFDTPRGQVVAAWQEEGRGGREPLILQVGQGATVTRIDLMGEESPLASAGGFAVVPVSSTPVFIRIAGANAAVTAGPQLLQLPDQPLATPGRTTALALEFANPARTPLTLRLRWTLPAGAPALPETVIELPVGGTAKRQFPVAFPAGMPAPLGTELRANVEVQIVGSPHRVQVPFGFIAAPALPAGPFSRQPDLVRADRTGLVELHRNVPQREHRLWQGPGDLSWKAWFGRQGDRLALRVEVRDDIHVQTSPATQAWQSDSVQVAFALPDGSTWWEFTYARDSRTGAPLMACGMGPPGGQDPHPFLHLTTSRIGDITTYETDWPLAVLGYTPAQLAVGLRCNLLVNDDDGEGRDTWLELAPGIGQQKDPHLFPLLLLE